MCVHFSLVKRALQNVLLKRGTLRSSYPGNSLSWTLNCLFIQQNFFFFYLLKYSLLLLFTVLMFYKVAANTLLGNITSLLLGKI